MTAPVRTLSTAEPARGPDLTRRTVATAATGMALLTVAALYALAATLSTAVASVTLRLSEATWSVPFVHVGDAIAVQAHAKTVLETGWYEAQPALGAPAGQMYHEFPTAENLHMMAFRALGWVLDDSATVMNAYYLLGFPLAAVTGLWFLRRCGVSAAMSVVLATLFALSPYHFERHEGHLFLASYWTVPLAMGVVLSVLRGDPVWGRSRRVRGPLAFLIGPGALTVVAMAVLGTSSTYYSVFVAMLLAAAGLLAAVRDRHLPRFLGAVGAGVALVATMVANMAPDLLFARGRPPNVVALTRFEEQAEIYALKLVQLVLPSDRHRFETLRSARRNYNETFPLPSESPTLGVVAAVGLVVLLVVVVAAVVRPASHDGGARAAGDAVRYRQPLRWRTLAHLSVLSLLAFLAATVGGVSSLIAVLLTDNLRGWSRMTILIALLALAAVGLVADAAVDAAGRGSPGRGSPGRGKVGSGKVGRGKVGRGSRRPAVRGVLAGAVALAVLAVGVTDQTSPLYVPAYSSNAATYDSDGAYVEALEADLPAGAMVFQLPYIGYPESAGPNGVLYTDQIRMYLHSTDLRWSAGGLKGRPTIDWAEPAGNLPVPVMVEQLAVVGFAGIHVDAQAYVDRGEALAAGLTVEMGQPAHLSRDGRYRYWSLDSVLARLRQELPPERLAAVAGAVLLPVVPYFAPDFSGPADVMGRLVWTSELSTGDILLDNPRDEPVEVRLSFSIGSHSGDNAVDVTLPGRDVDRLALEPEASVSTTLVLPPGRSTVGVAPPPDLLRTGEASLDSSRFQLFDVRVQDPVLDGFGS